LLRKYKFFTVVALVSCLVTASIIDSRADDALEQQLWLFSFLNFNLPHDRLFWNQDIALMQSLEPDRFTRIFLRSQINHQTSGVFSLHGGMVFLLTYERSGTNLVEIRPWAGAKLRWPYFWRLNFVHYLRAETRFIWEAEPEQWVTNLRMRYKLSTTLPINHPSLTDKTFFGILGYEFFGNSVNTTGFEEQAEIFHRIELGAGYWWKFNTRFELLVLELFSYEETANKYDPSDFIIQFRFRKYFGFD
jgi:hypothetical protein